jgi:hypothetical protein
VSQNVATYRLWHKWLGCMHSSLPNTRPHVRSTADTSNSSTYSKTLRARKQVAPLVLYQVSSRLITLLNFTYAPIQFSDVLILTASFKHVHFHFQIFHLLVSEMSTSFPPYITQVIFIHFTWVLQPLQFSLLPSFNQF